MCLIEAAETQKLHPHGPLTSTCQRQCVRGASTSSIYTAGRGWKRCQQRPQRPDRSGRAPCHRPSRLESGVPWQQHPPQPHPSVTLHPTKQHPAPTPKGISLGVSFVQPVIVSYSHESAHTVPNVPQRQWESEGRDGRRVAGCCWWWR